MSDYSYNPAEVSQLAAGFNIDGVEDEISISYSDDEDVKEHIGLKGDVDYTENPNNAATVEFAVKNEAVQTINFLETLRLSKIPFPYVFKDTSKSKLIISHPLCRIGKKFTTTRGKEGSGVEYSIKIPSAIPAAL